MSARHAVKARTVNSALWAAYGDALGFITELADSRTLAFRIDSSTVDRTTSWKRRIGGRFGPTVELPAGCYSDDTQLRLCTSRAIRADGHFDVEAFAKVELPTWLAYSLGAGVATKTAASFLSHDNVNWFSNFFASKTSNYFDAGGNGAAMRIQPHVWASVDPARPSSYLKELIRNVLTTHGNPTALVGAVFHAKCLGYVLRENQVLSPEDWEAMIPRAEEILSAIVSDDELGAFWLPVWKDRVRGGFEGALRDALEKCQRDIFGMQEEIGGADRKDYQRFVALIRGYDTSTRGSGVKTAILATVLSWLCRREGAEASIVLAANTLGSDTDTIASMAGALMGAVEQEPPSYLLADRNYIEFEAARLFEISTRSCDVNFKYPDLMGWRPPRAALDVIRDVNGALTVSGLGNAKALGDPIEDKTDSNTCWQWLRLYFGQEVLAKRRLSAKPTQKGSIRSTQRRSQDKMDLTSKQSQAVMSKTTKSVARGDSSPDSLDDLTAAAINSGFDERLIGEHLMRLAETNNGVEMAIAYSAIIAKAKRSRIRRTKQ